MGSTTVCGRLRRAREVRGLTLVELSKRLEERFGKKFHPQALWRWENSRTPSTEMVEKLAEVLGVESAWLAFDQGQGPQSEAAPDAT